MEREKGGAATLAERREEERERERERERGALLLSTSLRLRSLLRAFQR